MQEKQTTGSAGLLLSAGGLHVSKCSQQEEEAPFIPTNVPLKISPASKLGNVTLFECQLSIPHSSSGPDPEG